MPILLEYYQPSALHTLENAPMPPGPFMPDAPILFTPEPSDLAPPIVHTPIQVINSQGGGLTTQRAMNPIPSGGTPLRRYQPGRSQRVEAVNDFYAGRGGPCVLVLGNPIHTPSGKIVGDIPGRIFLDGNQ